MMSFGGELLVICLNKSLKLEDQGLIWGKTFNGILYVLSTGCRWSEVPKKYGSKSTVHRLHLKMSKDGIYDKIFEVLLTEGYEMNKIDLSLSFVDTKDIPAKKGDW